MACQALCDRVTGNTTPVLRARGSELESRPTEPRQNRFRGETLCEQMVQYGAVAARQVFVPQLAGVDYGYPNSVLVSQRIFLRNKQKSD